MMTKTDIQIILVALEGLNVPYGGRKQAITILQAALAEPSEPVIPFDLQQAHYAAIDRAVENVKRDMKVRDVTMRCKDYDILLPIIDTYAGHILVGPATHPASSKPEPDKDLIQALTERDEYHDMADKLAEGIALHFDGDIGEHSSSNSPWDRALDLLDSAACAETMRLSKQAALAEPSEQPVAWKHRSNKSHFIESPPPPAIENLFIPLYSREKQPHARDAITWTPETGYVFAHPATKPEPLTLGTIQRLWSAAGHKETLKGRVNAFARAVEAAVWEKMK